MYCLTLDEYKLLQVAGSFLAMDMCGVVTNVRESVAYSEGESINAFNAQLTELVKLKPRCVFFSGGLPVGSEAHLETLFTIATHVWVRAPYSENILPAVIAALQSRECQITSLTLSEINTSRHDEAFADAFAANTSVRFVCVGGARMASWAAASTVVTHLKIKPTPADQPIDWHCIVAAKSIRSVVVSSDANLPPTDLLWRAWKSFCIQDSHDGCIVVKRV